MVRQKTPKTFRFPYGLGTEKRFKDAKLVAKLEKGKRDASALKARKDKERRSRNQKEGRAEDDDGAPRKTKASFSGEGLLGHLVLTATSKESSRNYITQRCIGLTGKTIYEVLLGYTYRTQEGGQRKYTMGDLKYDIKSGFIDDPR
jgi:hypothetical protein